MDHLSKTGVYFFTTLALVSIFYLSAAPVSARGMTRCEQHDGSDASTTPYCKPRPIY